MAEGVPATAGLLRSLFLLSLLRGQAPPEKGSLVSQPRALSSAEARGPRITRAREHQAAPGMEGPPLPCWCFHHQPFIPNKTSKATSKRRG